MTFSKSQNPQKFLFDDDFSFEKKISRDVVEIQKKESFLAGFEEGRKDALKSTQERTFKMITSMDHSLKELVFYKEQSLHYAVQIAKEALLALFPHYSQKGGLEDIYQVLKDVFKKIDTENKIIITCHPDMKDALGSYLQNHSFTSELRFDIQSDEAFSGSDLHMDWKSGALFRSEIDLIHQIQSILKNYEKGDVS